MICHACMNSHTGLCQRHWKQFENHNRLLEENAALRARLREVEGERDDMHTHLADEIEERKAANARLEEVEAWNRRLRLEKEQLITVVRGFRWPGNETAFDAVEKMLAAQPKREEE